MERYLQQLIEDLEEALPYQPAFSYIESHLYAEDPVIIELAHVPFKSISEWIGIDSDVFPPVTRLSDEQCIKVNAAIFKVFDALHIELIDAPDDLPPEILYDILTTNWEFPVQYLPSSGFDLELCTGDPMTCPYGEFCSCGEEPDFWMDELSQDEDFENKKDFDLPF